MSSTPDRLSQDPPDPPTRPRKPRFRLPAEPEDDEPVPTSTLDPDRDLPGCIFMVPNEQWEIDSATSTDHPGACVYYQHTNHSAILVKGTDVDNVRDLRGYRVVAPAPGNPPRPAGRDGPLRPVRGVGPGLCRGVIPCNPPAHPAGQRGPRP